MVNAPSFGNNSRRRNRSIVGTLVIMARPWSHRRYNAFGMEGIGFIAASHDRLPIRHANFRRHPHGCLDANTAVIAHHHFVMSLRTQTLAS